VASSKPGPFQEFYNALLTKGIRPEMARLTLDQEDCHHRIDRVEERSVLRRPTSETKSSLSVSDRVRFVAGDFLWRWPSGSRDTLSRKSRRLCLAGLRILWLDPITQASELPDHIGRAESVCGDSLCAEWRGSI
jgi:hypothetical protein